MRSFDNLLHTLRLRSTIQNRVVLGEPWGVKFPPQAHRGAFHFVEEGGAMMTVGGQTRVTLERGDLAIVFSEDTHSVTDLKGSLAIHIHDLIGGADVICPSGLTLQFGGDGAQTSIISGDFCYEDSATHPIWRMLPPYILLKGSEGHADAWLESTLTLLSNEAMEVRPGAMAVLDRLCDVLFIQALRGWVRGDETAIGWPAALRDTAIDAALDMMQLQPAESWTVEKLARKVALSRSTFAERFSRLAGETPMEYLANWRMHLAAQFLTDGNDNVATIAEKVGYESEAAFAKAFKRRIGQTPGSYRRSATVSV